MATLVHLATSDAAAQADAMHQLVMVASAHESALRELAGSVCIARIIDIATNALTSTPEVAALAAWIFVRMADGNAVPISEAPQVLDCLARMLPSNNDRVRVASSRAVQALVEGSAEGRAIVMNRGRQDPVFWSQLMRHTRLRSFVTAAAAGGPATDAPTAPGSAPSPGGGSTGGSPARATKKHHDRVVLRIDGELALIVQYPKEGPRATTVDEVLRCSVVRSINEIEPVACAMMSPTDHATAASQLCVAFESYVEADSMAQVAMEQINDQCDTLAEELLDEESGESMDPELTADSERLKKALKHVSQLRVTQLPKHRVHGVKTVMFLDELAHFAKKAADEAEAFLVNSVDESGYDFGLELDDAPMDLAQMGEAAAKLSVALKKTGKYVHRGCKVRPVKVPAQSASASMAK